MTFIEFDRKCQEQIAEEEINSEPDKAFIELMREALQISYEFQRSLYRHWPRN